MINNEFIHFLENKVKDEFDVEEWSEKTLQEIQVTDHIRCTVCGFEKAASDMIKIFKTWTNGKVSANKGICKRCWSFEPEGTE